MATSSPVYLFKHVKHGTQNIHTGCHQWLSGSFRVTNSFSAEASPRTPLVALTALPHRLPSSWLKWPTSKGEGGRGREGATPLWKFLDPPLPNACTDGIITHALFWRVFFHARQQTNISNVKGEKSVYLSRRKFILSAKGNSSEETQPFKKTSCITKLCCITKYWRNKQQADDLYIQWQWLPNIVHTGLRPVVKEKN